MANDKNRGFSEFKVKMRKARPAPTAENSYNAWRYGWSTNRVVADDFTIDEINQIIRSGNAESLRELSRYYYRTSGEYRNNIDFLARLFTYDNVIIPIYQEGKGSDTQIIKTFYNACRFVDKLDLVNVLTHISKEWMKNGIYYGILRSSENEVVVQDLPLAYCRTRFKDFNNLNILEFNIDYFNTIVNETARLEAVMTFPPEIQKAWRNKTKDRWIEILPQNGGICFTFSNDGMPLLIASIAEIKKLKDAIKREETRDENELRKLLIQQMPHDKDGELIFQLEEIVDIHESVANMLADESSVSVLTTLGDTKLESLQDTTAASQSADRINKYKANAWDALGRGEILFNPDGSSALSYMIKKDEALMSSYVSVYETWIKFLLNQKFARSNLAFDFKILPITIFNRNDVQSAYFRGAQYGYSKMFAGVALGIKQLDQLSLMNFENDLLKMSSKMVPLQSSYTTSGASIQESEKKVSGEEKNTVSTTQSSDLEDKGGRPELSDENKSEKTQDNISSAK